MFACTSPIAGGRAIAALAAAGVLAVAMMLLAAPAAEAAPTTTAKQRAKAASIAASKVGAPYRWGATGPRRFDCSGLIVFSYRKAGKRIPVRTSRQMWHLGKRVKRSQLRRGDLVWTWDRSRGHVGVYLGKGRYVHAPGRGRKVTIAPLPSGRSFIGAVRP